MKTLFLIDANALIHRAYHALPPFTTPQGKPSGALYGLGSLLLKLLREQKFDYIAAAFDRPEKTFRDEMFEEYKATRPAAPNELISQIKESYQLLEKFGIRSFEMAGFEADDIVASLAEKFKSEDVKIIILTGDLDALQLVDKDRVVVMTLKKGVSETMIYDDKAVLGRFGVRPEQMIDYKALVGDQSDNIPGVPGVGSKTAAKLLQEFGSLEKVKSDKVSEYREQAFLAKKLVTLKRDLDLGADLNGLIFRGLDEDKLKNYFSEFGFKSLVARLGKNKKEDAPSLFAEDSVTGETDAVEDVAFLDNGSLKKSVAESEKTKIGFELKETIKLLHRKKIELHPPFFDVKIAGWLIDSSGNDFSFEALVRRFLKRELKDRKEAIGALHSFFSRKLKEYGLEKVFEEIEMPLLPVLARMEERGILINRKFLKKKSGEIKKKIDKLVSEIYKLGGVFNLNSPKQMAEALFHKLKIDPGGRSKPSTEAWYLETLSSQHPIIGLILEYRELFKLKSTYLEPVESLMDKDGRLRTNFNQTRASTGRLISENPNLQNIPEELREMFVAEDDHILVDLDYSQLELRILASVSGDEKMQEAFFDNLDIHKLTAAQVYNVPLEKVTSEMRKLGKTLNFGVVYGMGARAFARQTGVSFEEAEKFIEEYFNDFPRVREWQEEIKQQARTFGYVANLNGRRRWFLGMALNNPRLQAEAERAAINMPVQSLNADIIKLAMIEVSRMIEEKRWSKKVYLLLSIHDELLFEIKEDILNEAAPVIRDLMEKIYKLQVPLKAGIKTGRNWRETKAF